MKMFILLTSFVVSGDAIADIYKCTNPQTGAIEYTDKGCKQKEFSQTIDAVIPGVNKNVDGKALFRTAYRKKLDKELESYCQIYFRERGYTDVEYNIACDKVSEKYLDCAVEKQLEIYPEESNQALFDALEKGKTLAEAKEIAKKVHAQIVPSEEIRNRIHENLQVQIRDCLVYFRDEVKE